MLRSLLRPLNRRLDRQLRDHAEDFTVPRLEKLSGQIDEVREAATDLRRLVTDGLDASRETAALVGRQLAALSDAVDGLRADVTELRTRLDRS